MSERSPVKLIIQIPCFNEEETLPGTIADLPDRDPGHRRHRAARHRRRQHRPHRGGRPRQRRAPRGQPPREPRPGACVHDRHRGEPARRRRHHREHRCRQPVRRRRHPGAGGAGARRRGRRRGRHPAAVGHLDVLAGEEGAAARRHPRRARAVGHRRARRHQRVPGVLPRGRAAPAGARQLHLHAGDHHPGRRRGAQAEGGADPRQPAVAAVTAGQELVQLRPPIGADDHPQLRPLPAAVVLRLDRASCPASPDSPWWCAGSSCATSATTPAACPASSAPPSSC